MEHLVAEMLKSFDIHASRSRHRLEEKETREQVERSLKETKEDLRRSREELRTLAGHLMHNQEEERRRVARELHDDLGQTLALLVLEATSLARQAPIDGENQRSLMALQQHLNQFAEQVRRLAHDLHPSILTHLGLASALRHHCNDFTNREGIAVAYRGCGECGSISEDAALCLYRVAQESLRNVARHSGAKTVNVSLNCHPGGLQLLIEDGGRGFDPAAVRSGDGLGLLSMTERVRLVDGTISVTSKPGKGTRIEVRASNSSPRP